MTRSHSSAEGRLARRKADSSGRRTIEDKQELEELDELEVRRRHYWALHDFGQGHGLEIGPLHRAIVERGKGDVSYLDLMDREGLMAFYAAEGHGVDVSLIPEIDIVLSQPDGQTISAAEAAKSGAPYDWVVASHVIEHVPDEIGWLADIAELVADDGALVLAVPDKRYTADLHRPPTTVGQLLEAHLNRDERPSVRAVYDHFSSVVGYDKIDLWRGITTGYDARQHTLQEATEQVDRTRDGEHVDCHVWLYTPDTFLRQMRELRLLGRSAWYVEEMVATQRDDNEFRVRMRRIPRYADPTGEQPREVVSGSDRPEWVEHQAGWQVNEELEHRIGQLEGLLAASEERVGHLSDRLEARRARLRALEERTDKMTKVIAEKHENDKEAQRLLRSRLKAANDRVAEQEAEIERLQPRPWHRLRRR